MIAQASQSIIDFPAYNLAVFRLHKPSRLQPVHLLKNEKKWVSDVLIFRKSSWADRAQQDNAIDRPGMNLVDWNPKSKTELNPLP